jgi:hypothetical protein
MKGRNRLLGHYGDSYPNLTIKVGQFAAYSHWHKVRLILARYLKQHYARRCRRMRTLVSDLRISFIYHR